MSSFLILFMFRIFLGNIYAWRNFLGSLRGGVGWGLGTMFARQGDRYRTGYCQLCWILSEVQQPTSLRIHKSDLILGRYPPVILNVARITAIPRLILIDPLSLTMPCLQVKDIIILLRVSAEQWPLFKWKTRLITTSFTIVAARTRTCTQHLVEIRFKEENKPVL